MANHKQTPDVLGSILGGAEAPQDTSTPVHQQVDKSTSRQASKSTKQPAAKSTRQQASKETSQEARKAISQQAGKATFYLSQETLASLEEAWIKLRKMARTEDRGAVSKSAIVEEAILLALEDLETIASRLRR